LAVGQFSELTRAGTGGARDAQRLKPQAGPGVLARWLALALLGMENYSVHCILDFNFDCELDVGDRQVIAESDGLCFDSDLTNDGAITFHDWICFIHHYQGQEIGDPNCDPQLDYDCNGILNEFEAAQIIAHDDEQAQCQSPTQQAICGGL
jgi:hypothetical protein